MDPCGNRPWFFNRRGDEPSFQIGMTRQEWSDETALYFAACGSTSPLGPGPCGAGPAAAAAGAGEGELKAAGGTAVAATGGVGAGGLCTAFDLRLHSICFSLTGPSETAWAGSCTAGHAASDTEWARGTLIGPLVGAGAGGAAPMEPAPVEPGPLGAGAGGPGALCGSDAPGLWVTFRADGRSSSTAQVTVRSPCVCQLSGCEGQGRQAVVPRHAALPHGPPLHAAFPRYQPSPAADLSVCVV